MIYYKKEKKLIRKYQVIFDPKKVKAFQTELISNCHVEHQITNTMSTPLENNYVNVRNYGKKEYSNQNFYYSVDEYRFPPIIQLIEGLLREDARVIEYIFAPKKVEDFSEKIAKLSKEIDSIDNLDVREKKEKLDRMQELLEEKKRQVKEFYDYQTLKCLISFRELEVIRTKKDDDISVYKRERLMKTEQ